MKIAILGSGNVASHLSKALIKAGNPVMQVWSRHHENAVNLALEIGANSIPDIKDISESIEVVIIAVSDNAIENVASQIPVKENRLIIHTSGTTAIAILQKFGNQYGVIYPLQTFSKSADLDFSQVPLFIEGNTASSLDKISNIASQLSAKVQPADSQTRALLHVSAVFACNFTNHFYTIAQQILQEKNLSFDLLRPLIQETANKAMLNLPSTVQTGPAKRNDELTMNKHIDLLSSHPQWQVIYHLISQDIVKKYHPQQAEDK
ncbi:Rossmann-like and DUF2520 domain-containing protein [Pedobacter cryophilus]|uniref:DUF2520 domain-containing protein n=1 Tax=Pedobacter cryophilus TaxID=2571271 RepID=A0A4U1BXC3_9SPHI|nr:Rossmann-like and DUF2520 domain-containing protein [Pedobacter cryophilus]TKB96991.1 DUF2520 domain-containing protein [Pedobacter cryophilus]